RFFYLSLLGVLIAAGLVHQYRHRLGTALQHAAIWALIFMVTVLLYGFSEPLRQQLFPSQARLAGAGEIVLTRAYDGHFHAILQVNGVPVEMLVDTGASGLALSRDDAARVGFDPDRLAYLGTAQTANGTAPFAAVRLDQVVFGEFAVEDVPAAVMGGEISTSLLGQSFLDRFSRLSVEGDTLRLTP
ncbi:MAG: TIGR02281 family clan AA aspartic protease, partial [Pseudomonadota bacterium]